MDPIVKADILVTTHLAFVLFVLVGQLLIMVGAVAGWRWARNFWFRSVHLLCIGVVAAEGVIQYECPLTTWERDCRSGGRVQRGSEDDKLRDVSGSSWIGRVANRTLYFEIPEESQVLFHRGHIVFGLVVLATFLLAPPRLPWRKKPDRPREVFVPPEPIPVVEAPAERGAPQAQRMA
jgi:hypothetical protein